MMEIDGTRRCVAFGFAEGAEPITAFWITADKRFYCQRTTEVNHG